MLLFERYHETLFKFRKTREIAVFKYIIYFPVQGNNNIQYEYPLNLAIYICVQVILIRNVVYLQYKNIVLNILLNMKWLST